jgi:hypothetical protein
MLNTFHPFMATTHIVVLTGHGATACNVIFELFVAVLVSSDQQTKTGNVVYIHVVAQTCNVLPWTGSTYYIF